jgi:pimeloyl-ACP methyl ester carboxylesterase
VHVFGVGCVGGNHAGPVGNAVAESWPAARTTSTYRGELALMTPEGTYIEANGLRVYYEAYGEGQPLLLIHGGTATCRSWASHLPAFTEHFRVFAPDSRGHGRTDNPAGELEYRVMADDLAALIEALGLQRPLVLGYSDGGQIALELGMRYPGLSRALVLGGTQFRFSETYLEEAGALLGIAEGEEADPERLEREQPDFVDYLREAHRHVYGPGYWKTYVKQITSLWLTPLYYTSEDFAAVTDPVLLLVGDRDGVATEESVELFRLLPDAELAVAPASDHGFIEAKAALFDALVLDFLTRHRNDSARVPEGSA